MSGPVVSIGPIMEAANRQMNRLIAQAARGNRDGLLDRLRGSGRLDEHRQACLNAAMADLEAAARRGDEIARDMADERVEAILAESRAARQQAASNVGYSPEPPAPAPSFDGGVRKPITRSERSDMNAAIRGELDAQDAVAQRAREMAMFRW